MNGWMYTVQNNKSFNKEVRLWRLNDENCDEELDKSYCNFTQYKIDATILNLNMTQKQIDAPLHSINISDTDIIIAEILHPSKGEYIFAPLS